MSHTHEFFDELSRRGHQPLLERVQATIRFEVTDGTVDADLSRWVTVDHGNLRVSADEVTAADATIACSASELDDLVTGRTSAMASLLRGALSVQGDPELVVLAQRLFSRGPVAGPAPMAAPAPGGHARTGEGGVS